MSYETLIVAHGEDGITEVQLCLPEKKNALSPLMIEELTDMALTIGAAESTRAVILSGYGEVFCAGGDLTWMKTQIDADRETRMTGARKLAHI